eukprot:Phypoly_transcript_02491.p1 GENE.Phypoly_transcript_02491~~Phypoly_transcript_02491.p1  ORF type:complete len:555 (+),score=88.96 Phypoly_transcript_02491:25-1689(+)
MKETECPVCNKLIDEEAIAAHVNSHFDEEEPVRKKVRRASSDLDTVTHITEKKCDNCGTLVSAHDWIRHNAVHDDEAIALALAETPDKPTRTSSTTNVTISPINFDENTTTRTSFTSHPSSSTSSSPTPSTSTSTTPPSFTPFSSISSSPISTATTSTSTHFSAPDGDGLDDETRTELDKFKTDQIRPAMIDITGQLRKTYAKSRSNTLQEAYFCGPVDHHASQRDDNGWGCGYRNIQNMCSFLMRFPIYKEKLFDGCNYVPSVQVLQMHLEEAWRKGFDKLGKEQLGRVAGTGKWIGTTECAALLRSFSVRCEIFDFHCNCCTKNSNTPNYTPYYLAKSSDHVHSHLGLVEWVFKYFSQNELSHVSISGQAKSQNGNIASFLGGDHPKEKSSSGKNAMPCGPLYFQHQGHSRTIIGAEKHKTGKYYVLVLDPSVSEGAMTRALEDQNLTALKILRLPQEYFRHKRYQIARVTGIMGTEEQQKSKYVSSVSTIVSPTFLGSYLVQNCVQGVSCFVWICNPQGTTGTSCSYIISSRQKLIAHVQCIARLNVEKGL